MFPPGPGKMRLGQPSGQPTAGRESPGRKKACHIRGELGMVNRGKEWTLADIDQDKLRRISELEKELGVVLIAWRKK